jgi:hypothetical protein
MSNLSMWSVRLTNIAGQHNYRTNSHENVIAADISEAINLVLEKYAGLDPIIHGAHHQGTVTLGRFVNPDSLKPL